MKTLIHQLRILVVLSAFSCLIAGAVQAQPRTLCTDGSCPDVVWQPFSFTKHVAGCDISVTGQFRICNGVLQYRYNVESATGTGCSLLKDSTLWQLVDLFLIGDANTQPGVPSIPNCPTTVQQVQFITTACYIWQDCTYPVKQEDPVCDPPNPNPGKPANGTVDVWYWQDCGTACCVRTYDVCKGNNPDSPGSNLIITIHDKHLTAPCSSDALFTPLHCNDGC